MRLQKKLLVLFLFFVLTFLNSSSLWAAEDVERIEVRLTIRPTLMLRVTPTQSRGGSDLDLGTFYPGEKWKSLIGTNDFRAVILAVTTNLGMQYQVFQEASGPLQTDDGYTIDRESFRLFTVGGSESDGRTLHPEVSVPVGETPVLLFTSDELGSTDFFTVGYILDAMEGPLPEDQAAGIYSTTITYTVAVL